MLKVDLARLKRQHRLAIDESVPADDPMWEDAGAALSEPLEVHLEAQRAGADVVVRGQVAGRAELPCRRCLNTVPLSFAEEVTFLFRPDVSAGEAERQEVYPLPPRSAELDLSPAVREHVLLALPRYVLCAEACRGLCPRCGQDLNRGDCECREEDPDERWAALRKLRMD